jgi:hypothetical protein
MQVKSWSSALVLAVGTSLFLGLQTLAQNVSSDPAQVKPAAKPQEKTGAKDQGQPDGSTGHPVELNVMIAGLGRDGCDVEVKPGNRGSRFQAQTLHVRSQGKARFLFRDIELRGADRTCTFAITVRETGQASRTIYRGFRITPRADADRAAPGAQSFTCFMSSPSKLAGLTRSDRTRQ